MIVRRRLGDRDGREAYTLDSWLSESSKPVNLRFLTSAIELGLDPFRECVGGIKPDGNPAMEAACDHYPIIGESQCRSCKDAVCGLCRKGNPTSFPHGRIVCGECAEDIRKKIGIAVVSTEKFE